MIDKNLLPRFVIIESSLFTDNRISSNEKLLYSYICLLTNNKKLACFATNKYLAKIFNVSERQIQNYLFNLKKYNYIIVRYEKNKRYINTLINTVLDTREHFNKEMSNIEELFNFDWLNENE